MLPRDAFEDRFGVSSSTIRPTRLVYRSAPSAESAVEADAKREQQVTVCVQKIWQETLPDGNVPVNETRLE